ncbi:MAG: hypothetical protein ACKVP4_11025 [Hyphomicrobium sp.]
MSHPIDGPSPVSTSTASSHVPTLTWGWVMRRSMLWAGAVFAGVFSACALYGVASQAGTETAATAAKPAELAAKN